MLRLSAAVPNRYLHLIHQYASRPSIKLDKLRSVFVFILWPGQRLKSPTSFIVNVYLDHSHKNRRKIYACNELAMRWNKYVLNRGRHHGDILCEDEIIELLCPDFRLTWEMFVLVWCLCPGRCSHSQALFVQITSFQLQNRRLSGDCWR